MNMKNIVKPTGLKKNDITQIKTWQEMKSEVKKGRSN